MKPQMTFTKSPISRYWLTIHRERVCRNSTRNAEWVKARFTGVETTVDKSSTYIGYEIPNSSFLGIVNRRLREVTKQPRAVPYECCELSRQYLGVVKLRWTVVLDHNVNFRPHRIGQPWASVNVTWGVIQPNFQMSAGVADAVRSYDSAGSPQD